MCVHMKTPATLLYNNHTMHTSKKLTAVGFEPTQLALVELESTPLDHSGKVSMVTQSQADRWRTELWSKRIDGEGIFVQV